MEPLQLPEARPDPHLHPVTLVTPVLVVPVGAEPPDDVVAARQPRPREEGHFLVRRRLFLSVVWGLGGGGGRWR